MNLRQIFSINVHLLVSYFLIIIGNYYISSQIKCFGCSNLFKHLVNKSVNTTNKEGSYTRKLGEVTQPRRFKAIQVGINYSFISRKREDQLCSKEVKLA